MSTDNKKGNNIILIIIFVAAGLIFSLYDGINSFIKGNIWSAIPNLAMAAIIIAALYVIYKKNN